MAIAGKFLVGWIPCPLIQFQLESEFLGFVKSW
jgi:hypothetical protein